MTRSFHASLGVVEGRLASEVRIDVDAAGTIIDIAAGTDSTPAADQALHRDFGAALLLPGFVNAHSHAFQRGIRGLTQRRGASDPSNFWSWREAMYQAANSLDPEQVYGISRLAFAEMLRAGITRVGEFHYLHHQPDGAPYDEANELSLQVLRAAQSVGIRITLLEVYYARAGHGKSIEDEQRRFCDGDVEAYLARVDDLRSRGVEVGITPHSIRAVPAEDLRVLCDYANRHGLPIHTHLSEQPLENAECREEHGCSPAQAFANAGALTREGAFTAVHAVHIDDADRVLLSSHNVCACPTTEADLGDGIVGAQALSQAGIGLALGSDSNAVIDLVQEARLLEMHERLAAQQRLRLCDEQGELGLALQNIAAAGGARALGQPAQGLSVGQPLDAVVVDLGHSFFDGIPRARTLDALFTSGTASCVRQVIIDGVERL